MNLSPFYSTIISIVENSEYFAKESCHQICLLFQLQLAIIILVKILMHGFKSIYLSKPFFDAVYHQMLSNSMREL